MSSLNKAGVMIDLNLDGPWCTMFSPRYTYTRGEWLPLKNDRTLAQKQKLESLISMQMTHRSRAEAHEALSGMPIIHINCAEKWEYDIGTYLIKWFLPMCEPRTCLEMLLKEVPKHSIALEPKDTSMQQFVNQYAWNDIAIDLLQYYHTKISSKKIELESFDASAIEKLLHFEMDVSKNVIGSILGAKEKKRAYVYLDGIASLSREEQRRIMEILYARGWIDMYGNRTLYIKINNGADLWNAYTTNNGHRVQSTHDYSDQTISLEDLE
jgi:hypothetical protein